MKVESTRVAVISAVFALISLFTSPAFAQGFPDAQVSIISLIANPEKYHEKRIWVTGVANFEFEASVLWASKEALDHHVIKGGV